MEASHSGREEQECCTCWPVRQHRLLDLQNAIQMINGEVLWPEAAKDDNKFMLGVEPGKVKVVIFRKMGTAKVVQ